MTPDQISMCGAFLPVYFSVCCVSICFFPKMNILYMIDQYPTFVTSESQFLIQLNKEERKPWASSTNSPQGRRRLTLDKMTAISRCPSKSRGRFQQGLIYCTSFCLLSVLLMGFFMLQCLDLCRGQGRVFRSCQAQNHFEVLLWFAS